MPSAGRFRSLRACTAEHPNNGWLKWLIQFPRPFWLLKDVESKRNAWEGDYSTPSSHTQVMTALAISLERSSAKLGCSIALPALCVLTGVCRVYLGAHHLHDVFLGWLFGLLVAVGVHQHTGSQLVSQ